MRGYVNLPDAFGRLRAAAWPLHSWSRADRLALAGVIVGIVAVVVAIVPPLRQGVARWWRAAMLRLGFPQRKYAAWFVRTWGVYENPYLDDTEHLDLSNTYVPLSFRSEDAGRETLSIAAEVLADTNAGNLVIDGAPGSGKSTLLKAYGVGVSRPDRVLPRRRGRTVPFLVLIRKLARSGGEQLNIADFVVSEILVSGAGMSAGRARRFLRYVLGKGQALVMLDGLDEVTTDRYQVVLEAVNAFTHNRDPDCPSHRARVILTCRRQNFLSLKDQWIPAIASRVCSLEPLRDSEIFSYLSKLRSKFRAGGPESFLQAVRASGTLDLHRIPLILAMSVGLYARKAYYEVPSSIAELYRTMIDEMLDRHRFKRDPGGSALKFQLADKRRFLREFALESARQDDRFDEFSRASLVEFARSLAGDLNAVIDPYAFVEEIINHSGLLGDVGEGAQYLFAHRSIQEFLAAEQLLVAGEGGFLLERADNPEWRQVIQFYAVGLEQQQANEFLPDLAARNPELAGYCLAGARPSDNVAATVLDGLAPVDGVRLTALAAATMSPRISVQQMAIERLRQALSSPDSPISALGGEIDALLPLLNSLAGTNAAEIAALVPQIIEQCPDDPRLIDPLWRCLAAPGIETHPACRAIVLRLLGLATTSDGFAELARQDRYSRDFLTGEVRRQAYPFDEGLDPNHNLVTLLAWAQNLDVTPAEPNRYFEAKVAGRLDRLEADRGRTVSFSPFRPARIVTGGLSLAVVVAAVVVVFTDPRGLLQPYGWWTLALIIGLALIPTASSLLWFIIADRLPADSKVKYHFDLSASPSLSGHVGDMFLFKSVPDWVTGVIFIIMIPLATAVCLLPLAGFSVPFYCAFALLGVFFNWVPLSKAFDRGRRYYLYRPNPYVDVYDDPRSRLWLTREAGPNGVGVRERDSQVAVPSG